MAYVFRPPPPHPMQALLTQRRSALAAILSAPAATGSSGDLSITLDAIAVSSAGTVDAGGILDVTLDPIAVSATGSVDVDGTLSSTLAAVALSATGSVEVSATLSATLSDITVVGLAGSRFPLSVHSSGRYIVTAQGVPWRLQCEAAWTMSTGATAAEVAAYFADRSARGFNSIILMNVVQDLSTPFSWSLTNRNGDVPFNPAGQFDHPVSAYFDFIDLIIDTAASYGMAVEMFYLYSGYNGGIGVPDPQGWWDEINDPHNTQTVCYNFGLYLAGRWASKTNLILMVGGDYTMPAGEGRTRVHKILEGLRAGGCTQIAGSEWDSPSSLVTAQAGFTYGVDTASSDMQLDTFYAWGPGGNGQTFTTADQAWANSPTLPAIAQETIWAYSSYSGLSSTRDNVRKWQHWAFTAGATAGSTWGITGIASWDSSAYSSALTDQASLEQAYAFALYQSLKWWMHRPSGTASGYAGRALIVSGAGSGDSTITSTMASDGSSLLAYVPPTGTTARTFSVDLRSMAAASRARWWNPTDGSYTAISGTGYAFANSLSAQSFTTPGNNGTSTNDWMLVLDSPTATLSITIDAVAIAATGAHDISADLGATIAAIAVTATGSVDVDGTLALTLADVALVADGTVQTGTLGDLNGLLADVSLTSTGSVDVDGVLSATLAEVGLAAAGSVEISGTLSSVLGALALSATSSSVPLTSGHVRAPRSTKRMVLAAGNRETYGTTTRPRHARIAGSPVPDLSVFGALPAARFAACAAQRITSGYTGPLIEVVNESTLARAGILAPIGLQAPLDEAAILAMCGSARGRTARLYDQSGYAYSVPSVGNHIPSGGGVYGVSTNGMPIIFDPASGGIQKANGVPVMKFLSNTNTPQSTGTIFRVGNDTGDPLQWDPAYTLDFAGNPALTIAWLGRMHDDGIGAGQQAARYLYEIGEFFGVTLRGGIALSMQEPTANELWLTLGPDAVGGSRDHHRRWILSQPMLEAMQHIVIRRAAGSRWDSTQLWQNGVLQTNVVAGSGNTSDQLLLQPSQFGAFTIGGSSYQQQFALHDLSLLIIWPEYLSDAQLTNSLFPNLNRIGGLP